MREVRQARTGKKERVRIMIRFRIPADTKEEKRVFKEKAGGKETFLVAGEGKKSGRFCRIKAVSTRMA